jgi:hypothetical protein
MKSAPLRILVFVLALVGAGSTPGQAAAAVDYTQSATSVSATQAKFSFTPTTPASLVDVHYTGAPGLGQQNFRMTKNGTAWEKTAEGLTTGTVLDYWFTYEKGGPLFDTPHFSYTHGGGGSSQVATPALSPPGGSYTGAQTVTITTATAGASIRYTVDGSTPTASSTLYGGPISVPTSRTIKAIGLKAGLANSAVASVTYTIGTVGGGPFSVVLQNNTGGRWANSQIYVTFLGQSAPGSWSYLRADGTFTHINHLEESAPNHLTKNGRDYANMSFSMAQAASVPFPGHVEGGRIYVSLGSPLFIPISPDDQGWGGPDIFNPNDPNADVYYDWYEAAYATNQIAYGGNTTQVDQFGFPMTARLTQNSTGYDQTVGITLSRDQVFAQYNASVGAAFKPLAANPYRIVAPRTSALFAPGGASADYLQSYIDQVWNQYTANQFTLTRLNVTFTGRVAGNTLTFTRDGAGPFTLGKPTTRDVFQCSGALTSSPQWQVLELGAEFCAAFNRGVAQNTANWYNPPAYYTGTAQNDFAKFFHSISIDKRSYAFAYDDINDQSSVKILDNFNPPTALTLAIGW